MPLEEYKEALLREHDVNWLCELLKITPEDILDRFEDKLLELRETEDEPDES